MLNNSDSFIVYYNKRKLCFKINKKDERFKKDFRYLDMCIIIIEIIVEDNVEEEFFLNVNSYRFNDIINQTFYNLQFPREDQNYSYAKGKINSVILYEFT